MVTFVMVRNKKPVLLFTKIPKFQFAALIDGRAAIRERAARQGVKRWKLHMPYICQSNEIQNEMSNEYHSFLYDIKNITTLAKPHRPFEKAPLGSPENIRDLHHASRTFIGQIIDRTRR